jgi:hypothetical protein
VFVSSTILDFGDMRSSIQYLLELSGFEVVLSEFPTFPHALNETARLAAVQAIEACDYFVLLVGERYGSRFDDGISVTRAEFRRARELAVEGRLQLILFARASVFDLWRRNIESVPENPDWPLVRAFLQEVSEEREDVSNWINRFDSFRDVADTFRAVLQLSGPLRRRALEANLLWELRANIKACHYTRRGYPAQSIPNMFTRDSVEEPGHSPDEEYRLTNNQARQLWWFWLLLPARARGLRRSALGEAIASGDFLEYDASVSSFRVGVLQARMLDLGDRIDQIEFARQAVNQDSVIPEDLTELLAAARRGATGGVTVRGITLRTLYVVRNQLWNILAQSIGLARMLAGLSAQLEEPVTVPLFPGPLDEGPENDRDMTEAEVDGVLSTGLIM